MQSDQNPTSKNLQKIQTFLIKPGYQPQKKHTDYLQKFHCIYISPSTQKILICYKQRDHLYLKNRIFKIVNLKIIFE
jgi:DNA topoisomerase IB